MKKIYLLFFLIFSFSLKAEIFPIDPNIKYGKLENGLTYYIRENQTPQDKVNIKLLINTGSIMEEDRQQGLAHLLEHMAFNGSENFPKRKIDEYLTSIGLNLGSDYNASAGHLTTNYRFTVPTKNPEHLETVIKIISDISHKLTLEPEAFERERKIVEEEWRKQYGNNKRYFEEIKQYLYKNSIFLNRDPIGKIDVIQNFEYQDVIDYYQKWYQPELMSVFVIGDIDTDNIENLIKKYFNDIKNTPVKLPDYKIPNYTENQFFTFQDDEQINISFSIFEKNKFNKIDTFENYKEAVINNLIGDIFQRRISESIEKKKVKFLDAYITDFNISDLDEFRVISADLKEDQIYEGIENILFLVEQIKQHGFLNSELDLAKKNTINSSRKSLEEEPTRSSASFINEYERHFLYNEMITGVKKELEIKREILPEITVQDLSNYFLKYIRAENQILIIKAPEYIQNIPSKDDIDQMAAKISQQEIKPYVFELKQVELIKKDLLGSKIIKRKKYPQSNVIKLTLGNGANIYLKKSMLKKDRISLRAFSDGGYSTVEIEKLPTAKYTESILNKADIGELSVSEKDNLFDDQIVDVSPRISEGQEQIIGYSNNENLETMFKFLYVNFTDLRIKQSHVDRLKEQKINEYRAEKESPKHQLNLEFREKLYQNHPRTFYSTEEVFKKINLSTAKEFYEDRFKDGANFNFIIVGDFEFKNIEPLIEKYIGSLEGSKRNREYVDHGIRVTQQREELSFIEDNPKKATVIRIYNKPFKYSYKEKLKYNLMLSILDKMLFDEVREKDNLVYSINAAKYYDQKSPIALMSFYIYYGSEPNNVEKIDQKIDEILARIKNGDFDTKLFKDQKLALKNQFKTSRGSNNFWISSIADAVRHNLNFEQINNVDTMIDSITLRDIVRLAKKNFDQNYINEVIKEAE